MSTRRQTRAKNSDQHPGAVVGRLRTRRTKEEISREKEEKEKRKAEQAARREKALKEKEEKEEQKEERAALRRAAVRNSPSSIIFYISFGLFILVLRHFAAVAGEVRAQLTSDRQVPATRR